MIDQEEGLLLHESVGTRKQSSHSGESRNPGVMSGDILLQLNLPISHNQLGNRLQLHE